MLKSAQVIAPTLAHLGIPGAGCTAGGYTYICVLCGEALSGSEKFGFSAETASDRDGVTRHAPADLFSSDGSFVCDWCN